MSGGIFPGYPFTLNIKCIIFSFVIMYIYAFCPPKLSTGYNLVIYFLIFVVSYVSLAWYDYFYHCTQLPLMKGRHSFTGLFKPESHEPAKQKEHLFSERELIKNKSSIYWLHLAVIVPFLTYIAINRQATGSTYFDLLSVLIGFTAVYHGGKIMTSAHTTKTESNGNI